MTLEQIALPLGGRRSGDGWICRCPAHDDRNPSLSVKEMNGKLLFHCFAGCSYEAIKAAFEKMGYVYPQQKYDISQLTKPTLLTKDNRHLQIWEQSGELRHSEAEQYLDERGIFQYPESVYHNIRCHDSLYESETRSQMYALVAAIKNLAGEIIAIHRIYLNSKTHKKAEISSPKKSLGRLQGGAVWLTPPAKTLHLCEGIEDALTVLQAMPEIAIWAGIGSNVAEVIFPQNTERIIYLPDRDLASRKYAENLALRCASMGIEFLIAPPLFGKDYNEMINQ